MTEGEARGVVAGMTEIGGKLLGSLPTQFLMLLLINAFFIAALLWFVDRRATESGKLIAPIIAACLQRQS